MLAVWMLGDVHPKQMRKEVPMDPRPPTRLKAKLQESSALDPGM